MVCISVLIDFNSIKVRLEPRTFHLASKRPAYFNSIKVRLEHSAKLSICKSSPDFNSIKVRLEPQETYYESEEQKYFNSIKVRLEHSTHTYLYAFHQFQFHKGAIRTSSEPFYVHTSMDFNSIKVRLEQKRGRRRNEDNLYFNSIKVRLERSSLLSSLMRIMISIP